VAVLDRIIAGKFGKQVQIVPAGGDASLPSVARALEERSRLRSGPPDVAYSIEDRNYRPSFVVEHAWAAPDSKRLIWRRHEIENYLLEPRIVTEAFRDWRESGIRGSAHLPTREEDVFVVLISLAQPMLEHYAGWRAWHELRDAQRKMDTRVLGPATTANPLAPPTSARYADRAA